MFDFGCAALVHARVCVCMCCLINLITQLMIITCGTAHIQYDFFAHFIIHNILHCLLSRASHNSHNIRRRRCCAAVVFVCFFSEITESFQLLRMSEQRFGIFENSPKDTKLYCHTAENFRTVKRRILHEWIFKPAHHI